MSKKEMLSQARQWIEQERVWGNELYASVPAWVKPRNSDGETGRLGDEAKLSQTASKISKDLLPGLPVSQSPGRSSKTLALESLYDTYKECTRCRLGLTRIKIVFGVGSPDADVLFIGEGPGYEEDRRGEPFVGKAGQLLDKIMASIGLSRQTNAYIANIVKCHPMADPGTPDARGNDRPPAPDEVETCSPILLQQIAVIQPRVIVTLGSPSTKMVLRTADAITKLRGKFVPFPADDYYPESLVPDRSPHSISDETRDALRRIQVLPVFHPAALLRNPNLKADTWTDMKLLRDTLAQKN